MREEREKILKMLQEGKITVSEAESLLDALENDDEVQVEKKQPRFLRIKITDLVEGKVKTNINLPVGFAQTLMRFVPKKFLADTNLEEVFSVLKEGVQGRIIDVVDEEDHERVEIYID